jgi:adenine-specific DNA-methyltransferase
MRLATEVSAQKLRGGFYTPKPIAEFILKWGINGSNDASILEPSCGDGVFLQCLQSLKLPFDSLTAIEYDALEAEKALKIGLPNTTIINDDFHTYCNGTLNRFDLVVGNPPYIRYQFYETQQQVEAENLFIRAGLHFSKLTNAWVSFVVGASLLLKETGKIGLVIPAELLQVSYAKQLRQFISQYFNSIVIVSFEKLVFPDIQQEVVLLLCEKNGSRQHNIDHFELKDADALQTLDINYLKSPRKKLDSKSSKWTFYFLEQHEINFLETIAITKKIKTIGHYANVEVGITTGANDFFTVDKSVVEKYDLHNFAQPMVGRSVQVSSAVFTEQDWQLNRDGKAKSHLLVFPAKESITNSKAWEYLAMGESKGINKGYKCGIREDWFVVPSIRKSDGLFIRRNHIFPKMIVNSAGAYTTDTMHRVFLKQNSSLEALTASFYNSLSFAFAEINGRSYGGGVLELMPNEVETIPLPYALQHVDLLSEIDNLFRTSQPIDKILDITDALILQQTYGLSLEETKLARSIWRKLSQRRLNRKN